MTKPSYSVEEIEKIADESDTETVKRLTEVVDDDFNKYNLFDKGRVFQILKSRIFELLTKLTGKENDNNV